MLDFFSVDAGRFDRPVLVTGTGGCIGSWVVALLVRAGVPVIGFDLAPDKRRPGLLMSEDELGRVTWVTGDIADTEAVIGAAEEHKVGGIIHLAALQVPFCKADPVAGAMANVVGTVNVFEAARRLALRRVAYASSVAALAYGSEPQGLATLYGGYKLCNEHTAQIYAQDWNVPSIGLRPGVVYGVGRDQGMTSKTTVAMLAAAAGRPYSVPFTGEVSYLHAGEVAAAFIACVATPREGAQVFDINGSCGTVEAGLDVLARLGPDATLEAVGAPLPFPMDLSDDPLRAAIGDYGSVSIPTGVEDTVSRFRDLLTRGLLSAGSIS